MRVACSPFAELWLCAPWPAWIANPCGTAAVLHLPLLWPSVRNCWRSSCARIARRMFEIRQDQSGLKCVQMQASLPYSQRHPRDADRGSLHRRIGFAKKKWNLGPESFPVHKCFEFFGCYTKKRRLPQTPAVLTSRDPVQHRNSQNRIRGPLITRLKGLD